MIKRILAYLLILFSFSAFSRMPTNPYYFNSPDLESLIPFSPIELETIKNEKIKTIEIVEDNKLKTTYNFNELGQLVSEKQIWYRTKKGIDQYICTYKYNDRGLLILRQKNSKWQTICDSIAYDDKSKIRLYYSYQKNLKGKKEWRNINIIFDLKFSTTINNKYTLTDNINGNYPREYTFNKKNQVVKIQTPDQIDSVSTEISNSNEFIKKYWYKEVNDTIYKLGQEFSYKDNLLQTETKWDKVSNGKIIKYRLFYIYNNEKQLLRTEYENTDLSKSFFCYQNSGLRNKMLYEIITTKNDKPIIFKFHYSYHY